MVGLSVVVLVFVGLLNLGPTERAEDADADAVQVLDLEDPSQVERIQIDRETDRVVMERVDAGWLLREPIDGAGDVDTVNALLDGLIEIQRGVPLDAEGLNPEDFGLGDPPRARVRVETSGGAVQEVLFGDEAPVGWQSYARSPGGPIVVVEGRLGELLIRDASHFRDRRVLRLSPGEVREVRIEGPDGTLSVHGEGTSWWLRGFTRADPDRVDDLVLGLLDLRFDQVLQLDTEIAEPTHRVDVTLDDGSVRTVRVGEDTPLGTLVQGPAAIGVVYPPTLALLGQGPTDLGDRQALPIDLERDDRVTVVRGDQRWEVLRNGADWEGDSDAWRVLSQLASIEIVYRRAPVPASSETWATVEVARGDRVRRVQIGAEVETGLRSARDDAGGQPYLMADEVVSALAGP